MKVFWKIHFTDQKVGDFVLKYFDKKQLIGYLNISIQRVIEDCSSIRIHNLEQQNVINCANPETCEFLN